MSALPKDPLGMRVCPFCGVATDVPHETQEGCIMALNAEIGRMRGILASLRPTGVREASDPEDDRTASIRLALSDKEIL